MAEIEFMDWDYKEQPDMEELARIVAGQSGGQVHITVVPYAGGQEYAIAVCDRKLPDDEALEAYRAWERRQFEESFHG